MTGYSDGEDERISGFLDASDQQSSLPYTIIDEGQPACECHRSEILEKNYKLFFIYLYFINNLFSSDILFQ